MESFGTRLQKIVVPFIAAFLALSSCNRPADHDATGERTNRITPEVGSGSPSPNDLLLAAAEPFEAITEQAFAGSWSSLDATIATGRASMATARRVISPKLGSRLNEQLVAVETARRDKDRPAIALAAVETYRQLVEAQDANRAAIPIAVSLLDYAGFRFDALAQSPDVDWLAMRETAQYARRQFDVLAPAIKSGALVDVTAQSLAAMDKAVATQDVPFGRSSAATELAIVDLLEEYFVEHPLTKKQ